MDARQAADSLLDVVTNMSPEAIEGDLRRNRAEQERLASEVERLTATQRFLEMALALKRGGSVELEPRQIGTDATAQTDLADIVVRTEDNETFVLENKLQGPSKRMSRQLVLDILSTKPHHEWSAKDVLDVLHEQRGMNVRPESVRMMLQRLWKADELERPSQGLYRLPNVERGDALDQ